MASRGFRTLLVNGPAKLNGKPAAATIKEEDQMRGSDVILEASVHVLRWFPWLTAATLITAGLTQTATGWTVFGWGLLVLVTLAIVRSLIRAKCLPGCWSVADKLVHLRMWSVSAVSAPTDKIALRASWLERRCNVALAYVGGNGLRGWTIYQMSRFLNAAGLGRRRSLGPDSRRLVHPRKHRLDRVRPGDRVCVKSSSSSPNRRRSPCLASTSSTVTAIPPRPTRLISSTRSMLNVIRILTKSNPAGLPTVDPMPVKSMMDIAAKKPMEQVTLTNEHGAPEVCVVDYTTDVVRGGDLIDNTRPQRVAGILAPVEPSRPYELGVVSRIAHQIATYDALNLANAEMPAEIEAWGDAEETRTLALLDGIEQMQAQIERERKSNEEQSPNEEVI